MSIGHTNQHIHIAVLLFPIELVADLVSQLPTDIRNVIEEYFFDGESVFKIQRHRQMKRRDIETAIETGLNMMRAALRLRAINGISEII